MTAQAPFDFPFGYRSLTLNGHRNTDGSLKKGSYESDTILVTRFDPSRISIRDQREPFHLIPGGDLGAASKGFRYISMGGLLKATTPAKLDDLIASVMSTFDIDECQLASPSTYGVTPLTFYSETELAGYGPVVQEEFLCRPAGIPALPERMSGGLVIPFALELVCGDPRRYRVTAQSRVLNGGNGFSSTAPNWSTTLGMSVYPVITILMSAAGATNFTFTSDAGGPFVLNLSGMAASDSIVVDALNTTIHRNGVDRADLRTSAVSDWPILLGGVRNISASNTTGVTSVTVAYHEARG